MLGYHGSSQHFADITAQHGALLEKAQFVAIEADWHGQPEQGAALLFSNPNQFDRVVELAGGGRGTFQREQIAWLASRQKTILPCDYNYTDGDTLSKAMVEAMKLAGELRDKKENVLDERDRDNTRAVVYGAFQATRQWAILGQLGHWLACAEERGLVADTMNVPLILGSWHAPSQQRLEYLGVPVEVYQTDHADNQPKTKGETYMDIVSQGRITHAQLASPLPF